MGKNKIASLHFLPLIRSLTINLSTENAILDGRIDHPRLSDSSLAGASGSPKRLPIWMISRVGDTDLRVLDTDFEGLGPSDRTILGKRQPPFFTPREKLTPNLTIFGALARLEIRFRDLCGGEKAGAIFLLYFLLFLTDPKALPGACGGRSSQGGGRGRSDRPLKNPKPGGFRSMWSKIKLGNFSHSQNEENWINF